MNEINRNKTQFRGVIMLLLTAIIWGSSFVAQSVGMESIEAFTFNGIRTLMGAAFLFPFIVVRDIITGRKMTEAQLRERKALNKKTVKYGLILGVVFCIAGNFQQFAFYYSTSGKIAFVTSLYMFFVPLFGLMFRKRIPFITWICILFGFVGLYFLCIDPNSVDGINKGDILAFICSIFYAIHILMVERIAPDVDGVKLSCMQFLVSGVISCVLMFIFETPRPEAIGIAILPLLYSGIMSCGFAYTFQIVGQKYTEATVASLLMCTESVFAVVAAAIVLHETMTARETVGCIIMFAAVMISQLSDQIMMRFKTKRERIYNKG
jgi:drug/metabolite transporter (DMT)-like permease